MSSSAAAVTATLTPPLTRALCALCRERPADPVTFLAHFLLANKPPPPVVPAPVVGTLLMAPVVGVPRRVSALFVTLDANSDGRLTLKELVYGLDAEFTELLPHARALVPILFEQYAVVSAADGERFLDLSLFNSTYAAILYAHFDANGDGYLQYDEAQRALAFIDPIPDAPEAVATSGGEAEGEMVAVATAFPAHALTPSGELRLDANWFWQVFQRMG